MDNLDMSGELLGDTLERIAKINRQLGGNRVTISGVKELLKEAPLANEITIIDLGCGDGDMLRVLADLGRTSGRAFKLIGLDANRYTIEYARGQSENYPEISYQVMDGASLQVNTVCKKLLQHVYKQ